VCDFSILGAVLFGPDTAANVAGISVLLLLLLLLTVIGLIPDGSGTVHNLHTNCTQNTENGTYITIKNFGKYGPCPVFARYTLAFALQLRKSTEKPLLG
jgi:hypothetical protein